MSVLYLQCDIDTNTYEPMNDQVKKLTVRLAKTQTSLNTNPVSSDYFLCDHLEDNESWFVDVHSGDTD